MTYNWPRPQTLVITAILAGLSALLLTLSRPAEMLVDGQRIVSDVPPVTTAAKVYVPLRSVADALGAHTLIEGDAIVVERGKQSLHVKVGDTRATINGERFTLNHAPFRVRGRVMIGLKPISDAFRVRTSYDAHTGQINVITQ